LHATPNDLSESHPGGGAMDANPAPLRTSSDLSDSAKSMKRTLLFLLGIVAFWGLIYIPGLASPPMMDDVDSEHARIPG
jgi:hypothetical protein